MRRATREAWNEYRLNRVIRELKLVAPGATPTEVLLRRLQRAWGNEAWSGDVAYIRAVCEHAIRTGGPILECGSGLTTILMSTLVAERTELVSLEHSPEWCQRAETALSQYDLPNPVRHAALRSYDGFQWYAGQIAVR